MKHSLRSLLLDTAFSAFLIAVALSPARAGWPDDPAINLAIADGPGEQVLPKIALTSDGGCYVGWFGNQDGGYRVYMQRLDRWGNELWPHNGILISGHPQSTSLVDWDIDADVEDHAVLVFTDTRGGADLDVYAYRISPTGEFTWGATGSHFPTTPTMSPARNARLSRTATPCSSGRVSPTPAQVRS